MRNSWILIGFVFILGCQNPPAPAITPEPPEPPALQLPAQGLSFKLEQRYTRSITDKPTELRIEIGDITRGQTMITVWNGSEILLQESISDNQSFPFTWYNQRLSIACVQLDNDLLGPDYGYFKLTGDTNSSKEASTTIAASMSEKEKILRLVEIVAKSDIIFIRNGEEHTAQEAADHLRRKYNYAENEIQTVDQFIVNIASKSSSSNQPYQVKLKDGTIVNAEDWFRERIKEIQ